MSSYYFLLLIVNCLNVVNRSLVKREVMTHDRDVPTDNTYTIEHVESSYMMCLLCLYMHLKFEAEISIDHNKVYVGIYYLYFCHACNRTPIFIFTYLNMRKAVLYLYIYFNFYKFIQRILKLNCIGYPM